MSDIDKKYCPFASGEHHAEYCTKQCALFIDDMCAFAATGLLAMAHIKKIEWEEMFPTHMRKGD